MLRPAILLLALGFGAPAGAQTAAADPLVPSVGARVRVFTTSDTPVIGTLVRATPDTLVLVPERAGGALALARASVGSFEVSRGRPSRMRAATPWAVGGALLWGFGLLMAGDPSACAPDTTQVQCDDESSSELAGRAAGGAVFGAVLGGAFGMKFRRGERWQAVTLPARVSLTLPNQNARRGAGFAVAVSW